MIKGMSWVDEKLEAKETGLYGMGVFAVEDIEKGMVLAVFGGYVFNETDLRSLPELVQKYPFQVAENLFFGPIREEDLNNSIGECFNHSCDPNAGFRDKITLVAIEDIKMGEQVTFDYAMCMTSDIVNMDCSCGVEWCRRKITSNDWMIPELQGKYEHFFQPYIKEKIKNIH